MAIKKVNNINVIAETISSGQIVCMPTDTLYALSCDATNSFAVEKIYAIKKRDFHKKLPVFFKNIASVNQVCHVSDMAIRFAKQFWPGKLTMILPLRKPSIIASNVYSDDFSIAVRIPGNDNIISLIDICGVPLIGTSANVSGQKNIQSYEEFVSQFEDFHEILFWDTKKYGATNSHSTIITFHNERPIVLREGVISAKEIEAVH